MNWNYLDYASLWLRKGYFETRLLKEDILVKGEALKVPPTNIPNEKNHFSFCIPENQPVYWVTTRFG